MRRLLATVGVLVLVGGLAACSDDGDDESADTTAGATTTETTVDPDEGLFLDEEDDDEDGPSLAARGGDWDEFPCDILDEAGVEEIFGASERRQPPMADPLNVIEDDLEWTAAQCSWPAVGNASIESDVPPKGSVAVALADDFPDGQVACPTVAGAQALDAVGDSAQWVWVDPDTTLKVGELRVCTADALIDVRVSGVDGEPELQAIAVALANAAIDAL